MSILVEYITKFSIVVHARRTKASRHRKAVGLGYYRGSVSVQCSTRPSSSTRSSCKRETVDKDFSTVQVHQAVESNLRVQ